MLDPQTWLPQAQELGQGQRRYVDHVCGAGKTLVVSADDRGWSGYCFRCSDGGSRLYPQPSLEERIARLRTVRSADAVAEADVRPPMPANFDPSSWPLEARVWLYKAGLSNARIAAIGAYYCEPLKRVVLPVLGRDGSLAYWQARGFDRDRPKYINPPTDKSALTADYGEGDTVVLTEDILSAARVGEVPGVRGVSLLGTAISDVVARRLRAGDARAYHVWLDGDAAGRRAATKVAAALRLLGAPVAVIRTERDPKLHSLEEITQLVWT